MTYPTQVTLEVERTFAHPFNQYTPIKIRISKTYAGNSSEAENGTMRFTAILEINDELERSARQIRDHIQTKQEQTISR